MSQRWNSRCNKLQLVQMRVELDTVSFIIHHVQMRLIHILTCYCNLADEGVELMVQCILTHSNNT